ncbi:hypothetical protein MalM25_33020 [Planctomycetes bacterium MalM25]|nr:hypothetical protein MalM25_33020 [Planctomycetes bacterium MalM25]
MLRVNVGLSRKLTKNYDSTGFSINLDGEVCSPLDDPETLIAKVRELYDVADQALRDQIERHESDSAIAHHDVAPVTARPSAPPRTPPVNRIAATPEATQTPAAGTALGNGKPDEPATNKQVQYLVSIGKRSGLSTPELEGRIADILGKPVGLYDLTKREAGTVLDRLTAEQPART